MDYTLGVLVQSNFGGQLTIAGVPVGQELSGLQSAGRSGVSLDHSEEGAEDGSCMIVIATDAPLTSRNLERLAERALLGLGRTGGIMSNGSGDYVIAFSTAKELRIPYTSPAPLNTGSELRNEAMSILFRATAEATEEAIINSLFAAETMTGHQGVRIEALPMDRTLEILKKYNRVH
jgi:D-aminopeptidase